MRSSRLLSIQKHSLLASMHVVRQQETPSRALSVHTLLKSAQHILPHQGKWRDIVWTWEPVCLLWELPSPAVIILDLMLSEDLSIFTLAKPSQSSFEIPEVPQSLPRSVFANGNERVPRIIRTHVRIHHSTTEHPSHIRTVQAIGLGKAARLCDHCAIAAEEHRYWHVTEPAHHILVPRDLEARPISRPAKAVKCEEVRSLFGFSGSEESLPWFPELQQIRRADTDRDLALPAVPEVSLAVSHGGSYDGAKLDGWVHGQCACRDLVCKYVRGM